MEVVVVVVVRPEACVINSDALQMSFLKPDLWGKGKTTLSAIDQ